MGKYDINNPNYSYVASSSYENFMRRAFKSSKAHNPQYTLSVMQNLINTENGKNYVKISLEKQLIQIKVNIHKGFEKFLQKKMSDEKRNALNDLKNQIDYSDSSFKLIDILEQGIELTHEFI